MSAGVVVAVVFVIIFIIGVTVGIVAVIALSAVRADRRRAALRGTKGPGVLTDPDGDDITGPSGVPGHWNDVISGDQPRWPRRPDDAEGGFSRG